ENMRRGCLPAGNGPLVTGGMCTNPITNIPVITLGGLSATSVNSVASSQISPGVSATGTVIINGTPTQVTTVFAAQNAAGAFAERVENNSLIFKLRPNQQFSTITYLDNSGDSNYHAAQFTLRRRFDSGLGLSAAYTFGKSIDNQSVDPVGAASGGGLSTTNSRTPTDIRNFREERARSDFDRTHVSTGASVWEVPFGHGRRFLNKTNGVVNQVLGGWSINTIFTVMSGEPFAVRSGSFTANGSH